METSRLSFVSCELNLGLSVDAKKTEKGWTCELVVPFALMYDILRFVR